MKSETDYEKNYNIFLKHKDRGQYRIWNSITKKITLEPRLSKEINRYECFHGYTADDEGLLKFVDDFHDWNKQLKEFKYKDIKTKKEFSLNIDWTKYHTNFDAVEYTFKHLYKNIKEGDRDVKNDYTKHEPISFEESEWFRKCYNAGIMYCNKKGWQESYGYDYSSFYPTILASKDLIIPSKKGNECDLTELPTDLKTGFYRVLITSNCEHFKKLFAFSKHNVYSDVSLKFAMKCTNEKTISLIIDDKPNAYLYDDECLTTGKEIFGNWFNKLKKIKEAHPSNKLVKHLLTSLWGHLSKSKKIYKTHKAINEENISVSMTGVGTDYKILEYHMEDSGDYFEMINVKNPYVYNIRLKPFITAFGRNKIAVIAMRDIEHVIRIHTDAVVFSIEKHFKTPDLLKEEKSSGLIEWNHVNCKKNKDEEET